MSLSVVNWGMSSSAVVSSLHPQSRRKKFKLDQLINKLGNDRIVLMKDKRSTPRKLPISGTVDFRKFAFNKNLHSQSQYAEMISLEHPAIGGCRQCTRTFVDRVDFIHHMVGHFPTFFYSFEPLKLAIVQQPPIVSRSKILSPAFVSTFKHGGDAPVAKPSNDGTESPESDYSAVSTGSSSSLNSALPYYMCPHCCQTFAEKSFYDAHLTSHNDLSQVTLSSAISRETQLLSLPCSSRGHAEREAKRKSDACEYCGEPFSNVLLFREHMQMHFISNKVCDRCGRIFSNKFDLNLHIGTHDGFSFDCKDCGRCFESRKTLSKHNKSHRIVNSKQGHLYTKDSNLKDEKAKRQRISAAKSVRPADTVRSFVHSEEQFDKELLCPVSDVSYKNCSPTCASENITRSHSVTRSGSIAVLQPSTH